MAAVMLLRMNFSDTSTRPAFDFNEAVSWAHENFPEVSARVTFVDKAAPKKAAQQLHAWLASTSTAFHENFLNGMSPDDFVIDSLSRNLGGSFAEIDPVTGNGVLALRGKKSTTLKGLTGAALRHHHFMHEMGHLVVPGGIYTTIEELSLWRQRPDYWASVAQTHRHEVAADAFSFLVNISSGALAAEQAKILCLEDAAVLWLYPGKTSLMEHMTLRGIDTIITQAQDAETLSLSPAQKAVIAATHAKTFSMSASDAENLQKDVRRLKASFEKNAARKPRLSPESYAPELLQALQDGVMQGRILTPFSG